MLVRIHLSTDEEALAARWRRALATAPSAAPPTAGAGVEPADLLLVPLAALRPEIRKSMIRLRADCGGEIVVLQPREEAEERAALLGAGAFAVLPEDLSEPSLALALRALVERRQGRLVAELAAEDAGRGAPEVEPRSEVMRRLLAAAERSAGADASLLVQGETGAGKEWLARRIHAASRRAAGPFVAVNCAAVPESLWESELFGHERGAFTGAERAYRGRFELAHGGTLFLDEIGEMPLALQTKLLRVLEERQVQRLGAERPIPIDVRIIAASNRDLERARREGAFRDDLYYRLAVVVLTLPPLRERDGDVVPLADAWCAHLARGQGRPQMTLSAAARSALAAYGWPGNVRELANVVERALILAQGEEVTLADLPVTVAGAGGVDETPREGRTPLPWSDEEWLERPLQEVTRNVVAEVERAYLHRWLSITGGQVGETARHAGLDPRSLYNKMRAHGLEKEDFRRRAAAR